MRMVTSLLGISVAVITVTISLASDFSRRQADPELFPLVSPGNSNYAVAVKSLSDLAAISSIRYFVRLSLFDPWKHYVVLDSQEVIDAKPCDTNCFVFTVADETKTHLILAYLSPKVHYDTLYSIESASATNWLGDLWRFVFSIRDSVFSGKFYDDFKPGFDIMRIKGRDNFEKVRTIDNALNQTMSQDYTRIYYDCGDVAENKVEWKQFILVYDIEADGVFKLYTGGMEATQAHSRSSNGPVFFVGIEGQNSNLFSISHDGIILRLSNLRPPQCVHNFLLFSDHIDVNVGRGFGSQNVDSTFTLKY